MAPLTSKTTTPSNGAVTTVKTRQLQSIASSSSAPSQEPVPRDWESIEVEMPPPPTAAQLHALRALPAALHQIMGGRAKGRKVKHGKGEREVNMTIGNDNKIPWCKSLPDKSVIPVVSMLQPQSLLTTSTVGPTYAALVFTASSADNFSNLALVYDQYYIRLIEVLVYPQVSEVTTSVSTVGSYVTAVDVDDATVPTTYSTVCGYASAQSGDATMSHFHRWQPQFAIATYSGAFTSYGVGKGWIDCSSPNVQHFGLKMAASIASATQTMQVAIKYHMLFAALH